MLFFQFRSLFKVHFTPFPVCSLLLICIGQLEYNIMSSLSCQPVFYIFLTERRRRDLNPRAAINDLLTFQASPFSHLGTSPRVDIMDSIMMNGEGGIRTHAPFRTNGFQDRLVMTTSIPLHNVFCCCRFVCLTRRLVYNTKPEYICQHFFQSFFIFFVFSL